VTVFPDDFTQKAVVWNNYSSYFTFAVPARGKLKKGMNFYCKKNEFLLQKNQFFAYSTYVFWHALILPPWLCQWVE